MEKNSITDPAPFEMRSLELERLTFVIPKHILGRSAWRDPLADMTLSQSDIVVMYQEYEIVSTVKHYVSSEVKRLGYAIVGNIDLEAQRNPVDGDDMVVARVRVRDLRPEGERTVTEATKAFEAISANIESRMNSVESAMDYLLESLGEVHQKVDETGSLVPRVSNWPKFLSVVALALAVVSVII